MPEELTAEQAAARLATADTLGIPLGPGQPPAFLRALGEREDWTDLRVYGALLAVLTELFSRPGVHYLSGFFGPLERALRSSRCRHRVHTRGLPPLRAAAGTAGTAGDDDRRDTARRRRLVLPCRCTRAARSASCAARAPIRIGCWSSRSPTPTRARSGSASSIATRCTSTRSTSSCARPTRRSRCPEASAAVRCRQGDRAARRRLHPVRRDPADGIGSIPNQIATLLAEGDGGDYGLHSEMFTDGCMHLHQAGKITNDAKGQYDGVSVTTFAFGSAGALRVAGRQFRRRVPAGRDRQLAGGDRRQQRDDLDQRRAGDRHPRPGRRRHDQRRPVQRDRRRRGLRGRRGARAVGPLADLPAARRSPRTTSCSRGSCRGSAPAR